MSLQIMPQFHLRVVANGSSRKQKLPKAKPKPNEGRKDLSNVRVIQRRMAYIIGLPLDLADEELLQRKDYFGQYGKVTKVSLSRTAGGTVQQFINDTCSVPSAIPGPAPDEISVQWTDLIGLFYFNKNFILLPIKSLYIFVLLIIRCQTDVENGMAAWSINKSFKD